MDNDMISRQEAIDVLKVGIDAIELGEKILSHVLDDTGVVSNTRDKYEWGRELLKSGILGIENLSPAQPEIDTVEAEQKKGKWVDNTYCSECGWVHETDPGFIGSVDGFNFCPRCGADMREDEA